MDETFTAFLDRAPEDDDGWDLQYQEWYEYRVAHYMANVAEEFAADINDSVADGIPIIEARMANLESHLMAMLAERDVVLEMESYEMGIPLNPEPKFKLIKSEEEE